RRAAPREPVVRTRIGDDLIGHRRELAPRPWCSRRKGAQEHNDAGTGCPHGGARSHHEPFISLDISVVFVILLSPGPAGEPLTPRGCRRRIREQNWREEATCCAHPASWCSWWC